MNNLEEFKVDLRQVLNLPLSKNNPNTLYCPICRHKGCFSIYNENRSFKCFSCGKYGDAIDLLSFINSYSKGDALKEISNRFGIPLPETKKESEDEKLYFEFIKYYSQVASVYNDKDYWVSRGLSEEVIKNYNLGYMPDTLVDTEGNPLRTKDGSLFILKDFLVKKYGEDVVNESKIFSEKGYNHFGDRYIIPIIFKGKFLGLIGRAASSDAKAKYINSCNNKYFNKGRVLFNYDAARNYDHVYVVEGPMDCLSLVQYGIPNAVASMGTGFTRDQIDLLKGRQIILAFDNDNAGRDQMYRTIMTYKDIFFKVALIQDDSIKDFNDALVNGLVAGSILKEIDGPEFVLRYLIDTLDLSLLENRRKLYFELSKLIGSLSPVHREQYPLNPLYTPFDHSYYWTKAVRLVKGKRTKGGD